MLPTTKASRTLLCFSVIVLVALLLLVSQKNIIISDKTETKRIASLFTAGSQRAEITANQQALIAKLQAIRMHNVTRHKHSIAVALIDANIAIEPDVIVVNETVAASNDEGLISTTNFIEYGW